MPQNRYLRWRISRGFTLLELLIVVGVTGILFSLLLPAVQMARENAYRMRCQNNLMQLGVAFRTYNQTHLFLPSGCVSPTGACAFNENDRFRRCSGLPNGLDSSTAALFEQDITWREINFVTPSRSFLSAEQIALIDGQLKAQNTSVESEEDRPLEEELWDIDGPTTVLSSSPTVAEFAGRVPHIRFLICPSAGGKNSLSHYAGCQNSTEKPIDVDGDGLLYLNSSESLNSIPDGASVTLLAGETLPVDPYAASSDLTGSWLVGDRSTLRNGGVFEVGSVVRLRRAKADELVDDDSASNEEHQEKKRLARELEAGTFGSSHFHPRQFPVC